MKEVMSVVSNTAEKSSKIWRKNWPMDLATWSGLDKNNFSRLESN